jgi:hypothetical protein
MSLPAALNGNNASDNITLASNNSVPPDHQQLMLWKLRTIHHNSLHCAVPKGVIRAKSLQSVLVYNFTNMQAMSSRSDFIAWSYRINIYNLAVCFIVRLLFTVSWVRWRSSWFPTAMSDSKFLNTSVLKVNISLNMENGFSPDLINLSFECIFNPWWASMNVVVQRPRASNNSRHAPSWQIYFYYWMEVTDSPGIICIIWHHVCCHPSEHATSSMG